MKAAVSGAETGVLHRLAPLSGGALGAGVGGPLRTNGTRQAVKKLNPQDAASHRRALPCRP
jgi:hypothetical protein